MGVPPRRQTRVGRPLPPCRQTPLSLCRQTPPPPVNRQTCVRTLPCPKLRLQAVTGNAQSRIFVAIIPLLSHYCVVNVRGTTLCEEHENVYTDWVTLFTADASHVGETGETDRSQMVVTVITGWIPNVLLPMTLHKGVCGTLFTSQHFTQSQPEGYMSNNFAHTGCGMSYLLSFYKVST